LSAVRKRGVPRGIGASIGENAPLLQTDVQHISLLRDILDCCT
jgi:hypothetical protein